MKGVTGYARAGVTTSGECILAYQTARLNGAPISREGYAGHPKAGIAPPLALAPKGVREVRAMETVDQATRASCAWVESERDSPNQRDF